MKYKGRKKLTLEEAGEMIETTLQLFYTCKECVHYWQNQPRTRADILIEALCNKTRDEMIKENLIQMDYLESKIEYAKKFNPNYLVKGSFGFM